jgi:hypothetical protein
MGSRLPILMLMFAATAALAACGGARKFEDDRALFTSERPQFEELVRDIRACKGLRYDQADGPSGSDVCVEDGDPDLPKIIAKEMKRAHVERVIVWREDIAGGNLGTPDRLISIRFVTGSGGLMEFGNVSAIEYVEGDAKSPVWRSRHVDAYRPLDPAPGHWFYFGGDNHQN